MAYYWK